ncbi:MAG: CGGC domain-containing protein [bacterium]
MKTTKIGIIICDRYKSCAGGKCFKALKNRDGAFELYKNEKIELVGYTSCNGCPGGNIEYTPEEMIKNGAEVIHLATGLVVGYPPCPFINKFIDFIETKYKLKVVVGTHPIPEKYYKTHTELGTYDTQEFKELIKHVVTNEPIRILYN